MDLKLLDPASGKPKYRQIIDSVASLLRRGELRERDSLPSINAVCRDYGVSRDTVVKAYAALKRKGVIESRHGKEFYVVSAKLNSVPRALILLDELSMYKQRLVDGLRESLGPDAELGVFCHNNHLPTLLTLYAAYRDNYEACALIPAYDMPDSFRALRSSFPEDSIVILDRFSERLGKGFPAVYQEFESGVASALSAGIERLRNYKRIVLLESGKSHIAAEIRHGFGRFLRESGLPGEVASEAKPRSGDAWLAVNDESLVSLIKAAKAANLAIGSELGVISYNDTPLKEIIEGGVTVISADFRKMGFEAGELLKSGEAKCIRIETSLTLRATL